MKRVIALILTLALALAMFAGCSGSTHKSFTFNIDNGDKVKVKLETTGGEYDITIESPYASAEVPFAIMVSDAVHTQGKFIHGEFYDQYVTAAQTDDKATVLDSATTKNGNEYVFWSYDGTEFNFVVKIANSNTALLLANMVSEESAKACFERLTITAE